MPRVYIHAILMISIYQDGESQGGVFTGFDEAHLVTESMRESVI